jgi:hypothetical protein
MYNVCPVRSSLIHEITEVSGHAPNITGKESEAVLKEILARARYAKHAETYPDNRNTVRHEV